MPEDADGNIIYLEIPLSETWKVGHLHILPEYIHSTLTIALLVITLAWGVRMRGLLNTLHKYNYV